MTTEPPTREEIQARELVAAGHFLAEREVYGLAWVDRDLIVRARYGTKAAFIAVGEPLTHSVMPFIGAEEHILSFQSDPSLAMELPGVVIHAGADQSQRLNLSLFWAPQIGQYLLLIARASIDAALEIELLRHVRARLMAESETRTKSEQLARANRDLEDFASVVSHDLKAPMRALRHAAGDARAAIATGDLEKAGARLDWVMTQSRRLSTMLSGLLDYSSIGRKIEAMEQVDTLRLASDIRDGFPAGSRMCVTVEGTWPVIETVKAPLELVIRNLVENAAKHHDREAGRITLGCRETSDALWITVTDDGPGIAPSNWEAIFLPFRTLSATGAREDGIGLGLALVKRTLDSVGGNITLKSEANGTRGTQFDVMWPRFFKS